jgi:hypothetical protein
VILTVHRSTTVALPLSVTTVSKAWPIVAVLRSAGYAERSAPNVPQRTSERDARGTGTSRSQPWNCRVQMLGDHAWSNIASHEIHKKSHVAILEVTRAT